MALQKNQEAIKKSNIKNLIDFDHSMLNENPNCSNAKNKYLYSRKSFACRLLAFFQKYRFNNETIKEGYIEVSIEELFKTQQFSFMIDEFCKENKIDEKEKFFKDCFSLLEEHTFGRILNEELIEVRIDDAKIKNEIINLLKSNDKGVPFMDIFEFISNIYDNFFMSDYVKFVISQLLEEGHIQQLNQNIYQII